MEIVDRRFNQSVFLFSFFFWNSIQLFLLSLYFQVLRQVLRSVLEFNWFRFVIRLWLGYVYKGMKGENENDLIRSFCCFLNTINGILMKNETYGA